MDTATSQKVKRIAIVGPECTGKTDLAHFLAHHYQTSWVPEYAREYINQLSRPYKKDDLIKIAEGQVLLENQWALQANKLLFCDTTLVVIKIWSEFKYGDCPTEIIERMNSQNYALHLLTNIDIPWVDDPQREHPDKREMLFEIYKSELVKQQISFVEVKGIGEARREAALKAVNAILQRT
jgi:NadR type nicotinamide-nucleotide adenylyltransferase